MKGLHKGIGLGCCEFMSKKYNPVKAKKILIVDDIYNQDVYANYMNDMHDINGIVTVDSNETSHCVILAKAYDIPIIIVDRNEIDNICDGDNIFIEVSSKENCKITKCLNEGDREKFENRIGLYKEQIYKNLQTDYIECFYQNKKISILANVILDCEVEKVRVFGADGIGIYRTEFLFMNRSDVPDEEEQVANYSRIVEGMKNKPVCIRTIDIGGDKTVDYLGIERENNPFLGCRGIRYSLRYIDLFRTQIRAILRAGINGNVSIILPMVTVVQEVIQAKEIIKECIAELENEKKKFTKNYKLGMMVEVPAVIFNLEEFTQHIDFFSIGTNDLTQYIFAADRTNDKVSGICTGSNDVLMKIIHMITDIAHKNNKICTVCGEISSNPDLIPKLLESGVDELSVSSSLLLDTRKAVLDLMQKNR